MSKKSVMILLLGFVLITGCGSPLPPGCPPACLSSVLNRSNLSNENFSGADLSGAFLSQSNLSGANLSGADLSGADLSQADLSGADLSRTRLVGTNLENANLSETILKETNLSGANLTGAILTGLDLTDVRLDGVVLEKADLVGASLWGVDLSGVHFSGANLSGANLVGADLSGAILSEKDLLSAADLSGADLRGARLRGTDLHGADLRGTSLRNARLNEANLSGAGLWGADLTKADLSGVNFQGAILSGASLLQANLSDSNLLEAQLNGASLQAAELNQARLRERKNDLFLEADFLGAKYDHRTKWPTWLGAPSDAELVESSAGIREADIKKHCGNKDQLSSTLNMSTWTGYIDERILAQFEIECGVKVTPTVFFTNEELMTLLTKGDSGYDLMILSDYAVQRMSQQGLLAQLDKDNLPNISNLNIEQIGLYYDPANQYSLPYQWGTTGIVVNTSRFPNGVPDSWSILFDPQQLCQYDQLALMLGVDREAIGAALSYLGYSYNDIDPALHKQAEALLREQKECLAGYNFGEGNESLVLEEIVLAHTWSNFAAAAYSGNSKLQFFIPEEGGVIWQDNMVIPTDTPNKYTVEVFMNFLLDATIGAQLTSYTYAFTPNKAAEPLLSPQYFDVLENGGLLIDDKIRSRLEWIEHNPGTAIFAETWSLVQ